MLRASIALAAALLVRAESAADCAEQADPHLLAHLQRVVRVPAGKLTLGASIADAPFVEAGDIEAPAFNFTLAADLYVDAFAVSNARFAAFVSATSYATEVERHVWPSFVHVSALSAAVDETATRSLKDAPWWVQVENATWRTPEGVESHIRDRLAHPVVHVTQRDAAAFCAHVGGRLPSEDEWEYAARGGKSGRLFPWGNLPQPGDEDLHQPTTRYRANSFQGTWPHENTVADGFAFTAPVNAFGAQNAYGLYNLVGNVWEWTATTWCPNVDAVSGAATEMPDYRAPPPGAEQTARRPPPECLRIAIDMAARQKSVAEPGAVEFVKKGGSFTSRRHGDFRHRCAARDRSSANTSGQNVGFRCVYDAPPRVGFATTADDALAV